MLLTCSMSCYLLPFQKEERIIDVMSLVDEVEACLERAEHSSKACLEGIGKADLALKESRGDWDIQCVVLVRRTELLFIAVSRTLSQWNLTLWDHVYCREVVLILEVNLNNIQWLSLFIRGSTSKTVVWKIQREILLSVM